MPKLKSVRSAKKRFRKTKSSYKHKGAFHRHIMTKKSPKRKRKSRQVVAVNKSDKKSIARVFRELSA